MPRSLGKRVRMFLVVVSMATLILAPPAARAQATISTGSVQGTLTDSSGAVVTGAKVTIINTATNQQLTVYSTGSGLYSSGALIPGDYRVRIEKPGFQAIEFPALVQVGVITPGNYTLKPGAESQTITVEASAVQVNTQQATVQGVLNAEQIENLPINGRNFLELAQLEPGVQIQEGSTFDPTKNGFSSISFGSRFGRTARIEIDGVDISDETVGTTTQNVPASAIQEFQLSQSSLDLSTELTSSGAVNVTTRSGTNSLHGEAFGLFRDSSAAAALPGPVGVAAPFQRSQYGGRLGGPLIKDKLFWFIDAEHTKQALAAPETWGAPFTALSGTVAQPFHELETMGRLDWQIKGSARMFYRFNFDQNNQIRPFGSASSFQPFRNVNHTPSHVVGVDFNTGSLTHSIRFEYLKFRNAIVDSTASISGPDNPIPGLGIDIGSPNPFTPGNCPLNGGGAFCAGPNWLAPQKTFQSDHQIKYDGSKLHGAHIFRYGIAYNHIQGGGFAAFNTYPQVGTTTVTSESNPLLYPVEIATLGNGVGYSTNLPAFGAPAGGLGPDNRLEWYVGDNWKLRKTFTLSMGLHYVLDTGRVDSNLGPLPALNQWAPGLGDQVRTPTTNFAPQVGFAWDVIGNGKTVIRGGGGLFFENAIWNNILFDSPARIPTGIFALTPYVCLDGVPQPFAWPTTIAPGPVAGGAGTASAGNMVSANFCGLTIGSAASQVFALSNAYQAAAASSIGPVPNPSFIGTTLTGQYAFGLALIAPDYRTPRSWQTNIGIQRQIRPGMVLSADYLRNIGEHFLIAIDENHSGAARFFNLSNAIAARDNAQTAAGCPPGPSEAACMIKNLGVAGAQAAYSTAGLDSNTAVTGGAPCSYCAFPGSSNGALGAADFLFPIGRSVYNGLQVKLQQNVAKPFPGVKQLNLQVSYALSRFVSQVQDQDFINVALNNDNPLQYTGPNALDRTHQLSFGGVFDLPGYTRLSLIGHFYSPLPQNLSLPELTNGGEIFASNPNGDGTVGDIVPGTQLGEFGRGINIGNLQSVINTYNSTYAGQLTPAGKQVVNNGVMTLADMQALGWVMPALGQVVPGAVGFPWLKVVDFKASWPIKLRERWTVEPSVAAFNIFNFANSFLPGNLPGGTFGTLNPSSPCLGLACASVPLSASSVGGVNFAQLTPFRASMQSGTYALGAPRQFEFGLRLFF